MRHAPKWMILFLFGVIAVTTVSVYSMQSFRYNDLNDILNEATMLALNKSMDFSSRVDAERMKIDETVFEQTFKEQFQKSNVKVDVQEYDFDYLKTDTGYLKAVKIKVTDEEDTTYQTTYVTNTTNTTES